MTTIYRALLVAALLVSAPAANSAASCVGNSAGGYPCKDIDLAGHLGIADLGGAGTERLNDIWGWTDPDNGEEYAIVGMTDGTAFVRLGDGSSPQFLGRLPASDGQASFGKPGEAPASKSCLHDDVCSEEGSTWRDVKVYGNHAYVVSEGYRHGVQVFDLTRLRGVTAAQAWDMDGYFGGLGHAHNIAINEASARAYVVGNGDAGSAFDGGLFVLDLSDPVNPVSLGEVNIDGYTHDAQCVTYAGPDTDWQGSEICFAANEDTITILDVTDPANPSIISKYSYYPTGYVHQAWVSEDHTSLFLNDELDERGMALRTRLRVLDVTDLDSPASQALYVAPTLSIDHNNYVDGRWLYQANYTAGLRILDVTDPSQPVEAAFFDTQGGDSPIFEGLWSVYPYFDSGLVVASDIHDGLFVLAPALQPENGSDLEILLGSRASGPAPDGSMTITQGDSAELDISIANTGSVAAEDVYLTFHLPLGTGASSVVAAPAGFSCAGAARVVACTAASVPAGSSAILSIDVASTSSTNWGVVAMAYGSQADAAPGNNIDKFSVTVQASTSGGGGGGGYTGGDSGGGGGSYGSGSLGWPLLLLAGLLAAMRRR